MMNYWKFMDSEKQKGQELVVEIEEEFLEGEEGIPEGEQKINFEQENYTTWEEYGLELDRDRNVTPISKLVPASVNDLKWDCFTGKCYNTNMCLKKEYIHIHNFLLKMTVQRSRKILWII